MTEKIHQSSDSLAMLDLPIQQHARVNAPKQYVKVPTKCRFCLGWGERVEMRAPHRSAKKMEKNEKWG